MKYFRSDGTRPGGFISRTRMIYCLGGESLNDVSKKERYKAEPIKIIPDEPSEEPYYPEAPGPIPTRPALPKYLQKKNKRPPNAPGPSASAEPNDPAPAPSRVSKRARKAPNRLIEE